MRILYEGRDSYGVKVRLSKDEREHIIPSYWITVHGNEKDGNPSPTASIPMGVETMNGIAESFVKQYRMDGDFE